MVIAMPPWSCTDSCPKLSGALARLQHELADEPDVRLVSLTVDPARDTPATLSRYAAAFNYQRDPNQFAAEVHKAGYATDPGYTTKLVNLMTTYNLYPSDLA